MTESVYFIHGDALDRLRQFGNGVVHTCVTSPPYFGLRDYGEAGQIGLEKTPSEYVARLVEIFREVRRALRDDGTLWLNLGDSYAHGGCGSRDAEKWPKQSRNDHLPRHAKTATGFKPKELMGIPWRVAFALQDDGWFLRQDIVWSKPNAMPESVRDRCTRSHEYIFMFSKSRNYFYDADAIAEPAVSKDVKKFTDKNGDKQRGHGRRHEGFNGRYAERIARDGVPTTRNKRSVWQVSAKPFKGAHFATFPPDLIEPCILAGSPVGGVVLDPFGGSGTTNLVSKRLGRIGVSIELNANYIAMAQARCAA